jgi:hypothetical protein
MASPPESIVRSWKIDFVFYATGAPVPEKQDGSVSQCFRFSLPTAARPVPELEVAAKVTVRGGDATVSLEGAEYEYSGATFAKSAQQLLHAALTDKAHRTKLEPEQ